jgi:hypothetical protein
VVFVGPVLPVFAVVAVENWGSYAQAL